MLKSMTGYGVGEAVSKACGKFVVELSSTNRKYCEVVINLPKQFLVLESRMREIIQKEVARGRVNVFVSQPKQMYRGSKLVMDSNLARQYLQSARKLKKELKLKGEVDLNLLVSQKEIVTFMEPQVTPSGVWPAIEKALINALKEFNKMRMNEGSSIASKIVSSIGDIKHRLTAIERLVPEIINNFKTRLEKRLGEIRISLNHTDERVQKEIAILAESIDITEELNRLGSHIAQFTGLVKKTEPVGRTLDFLIQEMMREVNTTGSKAQQAELTTHVVYIKSELEKIREQIQNVE